MLALYEREENFLESPAGVGGARLVNYTKIRALADCMHKVLQFRAVLWKTSGASVAHLREFLLRLPFLCEDDLLAASDKWVAKLRSQRLMSNAVTPADEAAYLRGVTAPEARKVCLGLCVVFPLSVVALMHFFGLARFTRACIKATSPFRCFLRLGSLCFRFRLKATSS